jgi:hypothetical protein
LEKTLPHVLGVAKSRHRPPHYGSDRQHSFAQQTFGAVKLALDDRAQHGLAARRVPLSPFGPTTLRRLLPFSSTLVPSPKNVCTIL